MMRRCFLSILAVLALVPFATAQGTAWRFRWQTGQALTYRVAQTTIVTDTVGETTVETRTKLDLTKRWQVLEVDPAGIATIQLSILAMRNETTRPNKEVMLFDSTEPDKSTPELREALKSYINAPLAVLRVDASGRVVEVKESKFGPASRFESTPPFVVHLPGAAPQANQYWERNYAITLEPPQGTGEKTPAVQRYLCKEVKPSAAILELTTTLKTPPAAVADQLPLLQSLPEGEIVFDPQAGLFKSAKLHIDKELKGHQGEGSVYHFQYQYTEEYVPNP